MKIVHIMLAVPMILPYCKRTCEIYIVCAEILTGRSVFIQM
jgi:hypothetical protein